IVRVRPFVRVATNLTTNPSDFASNVPEFNPVKLMQEEDVRTDDGPQIEPTGELSIVMRDLTQVPATARIAATMRNDDVLYSVRQAIASSETELQPTMTASMGIGLAIPALAFAGGANAGEPIETPTIAENLSAIPKT